MAGLFTETFRQSFAAQSVVVVTHNLNRENLYVRLLVGDVVQQQLVASTTPTLSDPLNEFTLVLTSSQTGVIQILEVDTFPVSMPIQVHKSGLRKHNFEATTDPTVTNDNTEGYGVRSVWVNAAAFPPRVWAAVDVSIGAAEWIRQTNLKSNIATVAPTSTDDADSDYEIGSQWYDEIAAELFICVGAAVGAAEWRLAGQNSSQILAGVEFPGSLLDYPAVGSLAADEIQYVAQRLFEGKVYDRVGTFIDSGGTAGRDIQMGVYDQATPSASIVAPDTRVAQTDVDPTNVTQPGFTGFLLTDGAGTPQTYSPPVTGVYWLAFTISSNAVKFAASVQFRENYLFRVVQSGGGGLPASASALSNPAASMILVGLIEVGVTIPS